MEVITRRVKTLAVQSNALFGQEVPVNLPRQHFYVRLTLLAVLGTLAGGSSPAWVAGAANKLVKNLRLEIGGTLSARNLTFEDLRKVNLLTYKDVAPAAGYAFMDLGLLPSHLFPSLVLYVTFDTLANLTTGSPTSAAGTELRIRSKEVINAGQSPANVPLVVHKVIEKDLVSLTGDQPIDIRDGNRIQALIVIPSSTTLLNHLTVMQDGIKPWRHQDPYAVIQEENRADFELDATPTDFAVINFDQGDGVPLDSKQTDTLELIANINSEASGKVRVLVIEQQAPPAKAA